MNQVMNKYSSFEKIKVSIYNLEYHIFSIYSDSLYSQIKLKVIFDLPTPKITNDIRNIHEFATFFK